MNNNEAPAAVADLAAIVRNFLPEGEVTAETLAAAVTDAQESWDRFFVLAIRDANLSDFQGRNGHLAKHLAGTYDEIRTRAGLAA